MIAQALPLPADRDLLTTIAVIVFAFGGVGGIIALLRFRPEARKIAVETAEGAVVVAGQVLENVLAELERQKTANEFQRAENEALRERVDELVRTSGSVDRLRERVEQLEDERDELRDRVAFLEADNLRLMEELDVVKEQQDTTNGKGQDHG